MILAFVVLAAMSADPGPGTEPKRDVVLGFATCVERRAPDRVRELLATEPGSDREHKLMNLIAGAYGACTDGRRILSFSTGMLRGQLSEQAFRKDPALLDRVAHLPAREPNLPDVAAIDAQAAKVPVAYRQNSTADLFRGAYGQCVALSGPSIVTALLPTQPASNEERAAMLTASDRLMRCMPKDITYHLKAAELRPYIMSALYYAAVRAPAGVN